MDQSSLQAVLSRVRRIAENRPAEELTDGALLLLFSHHHDEGAFAELVRRHGPMVREVCLRIVHQECDADDAFQATFLVLVQKARSIRKQPSVGSWLYGVATRVAWRARARAQETAALKSRLGTLDVADPAREAAWRELLACLDQEVFALPERYRGPVVLCYLEGQTQDEAARQLGWSLRTLKRRLERGRQLLRLRLNRRGLTLSATLLTAGLVLNRARAVPAPLGRATIESARLLIHQGGLLSAASANVAALVTATNRIVDLTRTQLLLAWALAATVAAGGAGFWIQRMFVERPEASIATAPLVAEEAPGTVKQPATDADGEPLPGGALRRIGSLRFRHGGVVECLLPLPDGKTLISNSCFSEGAVELWDVNSGKLLRRLPGNYEGKQIAVSTDGKTLAVARGDAIRLWDLPSGKEARVFTGGHREVLGLAFAPDGRTLASAGLNKTICLRDPATGQERSRLAIDMSRVGFLAFTPDGQTLMAGDSAGVCILDLKSGAQTCHCDPGTGIDSLAMSPDGRTAGAGTQDGRILLWDTATQQLRQTVRAQQRFVTALAFSPNGQTLAWSESDGGGENAPICLWDLSADRMAGRLRGHGFWVDSLAFALDGRTLYSGCRDGTIGTWDLVTSQERPAPGANRYRVNALNMAPDNRTLAIRNLDRLSFWDVATSRHLGAFPGYQRGMTTTAFSPDWRTLAVGGRDHAVALWDVSSRQLIRRLAPMHKPDPAVLGHVLPDPSLLEVIGGVAFSPDGKKLASGGWDTVLRIWDVETGMELRQLTWARQRIGQVAFSPDNKLVAAVGMVPEPASWQTSVRFWEVATGKDLTWLSAALTPPRSLNTADSVKPRVSSAPIFSPDGRLIVRLDTRTVLPVWELATGRERLRLQGHQAPLIAAAFAPDARTLATASWDGTIRLWDVGSGAQLGQFTGHRGNPVALSFSADGKVLASGGEDTTVLVWDVDRITHRRAPLSNDIPDQEFQRYWSDLAGSDAHKANHAIGALAAAPPHTLAWFKEHLLPCRAPEARQIEGLLQQLESDQFITRDHAAKDLASLGPAAEPDLRRALSGPLELDARKQLEKLLAGWNGPIADSETLRGLRALETLERIGTSEARDIVKALAGGTPDVPLTDAAKATFARLCQAAPSVKGG
jgi:RNA polymerase sigma factor (sigma-70 family)